MWTSAVPGLWRSYRVEPANRIVATTKFHSQIATVACGRLIGERHPISPA